MRLEIEGIGGGGRGVAKAGGRVWFVAGALPGEVAEVEVERERAGIVEARAVGVSNPSPWRDADPVLAAAVREAPVEVSAMGWRMRARLRWDPAGRTLGFLGPRSRTVVEISPCRVVSPLLLGTLREAAAALESHGVPAGELEWIEDLEARAAVAGWRGRTVPPPPLGRALGFHPLREDQALGAGGWGETGVVMNLPIPLRVPVGVFFQGNRHLVPRLFGAVAALVGSAAPERVVDLYAGVGLLGAAARSAGARALTLVEASAAAAEAARGNLPGAEVVAGTAEAFLEDPGPAAGTLAIVDPPRTGLSRRAGEALARWRPDAVAMLSCDAARFGRDGGRLLGAGYRLESVVLWDLFAGSHHVEVLADFRRARG